MLLQCCAKAVGMTKFWAYLKSLFPAAPNQRQLDEQYLAESYDLVDLERRLKELERRNPHLYRR